MSEVKTTERLDEIAGKICKAVIPIRKEYYLGRGSSVAICTLSSLDLLDRISQTAALMDRIAIVGRLLSENKGIDAMVGFAAKHPNLERIVLCGKEVKGHQAGQALLSLAKNGINPGGRIIGALGPYPLLRSEPNSVSAFRNRVQVVDLMGTTKLETIIKLVT
ncbi:MAG: tetrahydromethanopterin S-methyltransferase subunit A [Nitrososphaera sp.]